MMIAEESAGWAWHLHNLDGSIMLHHTLVHQEVHTFRGEVGLVLIDLLITNVNVDGCMFDLGPGETYMMR